MLPQAPLVPSWYLKEYYISIKSNDYNDRLDELEGSYTLSITLAPIYWKLFDEVRRLLERTSVKGRLEHIVCYIYIYIESSNLRKKRDKVAVFNILALSPTKFGYLNSYILLKSFINAYIKELEIYYIELEYKFDLYKPPTLEPPILELRRQEPPILELCP